MTVESTPRFPSYFRSEGQGIFKPTRAVGGGWNPEEQHIAPVLGLLTHCIESAKAPIVDIPMSIGRLSFDILGVLNMESFEVRHQIARSGRTIELHEAQAWQRGRLAVQLRAWKLAGYDTFADKADRAAADAGVSSGRCLGIGKLPGGLQNARIPHPTEQATLRRQNDSEGRAQWYTRFDG